MKRYLFDTNTISLWFDKSLPEKWLRHWKEIKMGNILVVWRHLKTFMIFRK